ncbi:MAG: esterase family protein [Polyangiaceae bacterium]|nr:esterase family protein [Polyangiaceae bacterium]
MGGQQAWVHDEGFSSGYFLTFDAFSAAGEAPRKIHVFLPRSHGASCERYPVVYMNDGVTSFWPGGPGNKSWQVAQGLAGAYQQGTVRPVIVVAIHALDRNLEYSHTEWSPGEPCCGVEGYADYVGDRVKGFVDEHFRTLKGPEDTAIVGSSRGGLGAFLLSTLRPDRFRKAACLSPSFWLGLDPVFSDQVTPGPLATSKLLGMAAGVLDDPTRKPTLWIDWGLVFTGGFHNEVIEKAAAARGKEMVDLLKSSHGYQEGKDLFRVEDPAGEHDEISWARRFPAVMKALFPAVP